LTGYIAKGLALCGQHKLQEAMRAFDLAFMFTNEEPKTIHFLLLIKACQNLSTYSLLHNSFQAIALFNANEREDAMSRVEELTGTCPSADTHACRIIKVSITHLIRKLTNFAHQAYLCLQLGIDAWDSERHEEAIDYFTKSVKTSAFSSKWDIHTIYEDFVVVC